MDHTNRLALAFLGQEDFCAACLNRIKYRKAGFESEILGPAVAFNAFSREVTQEFWFYSFGDLIGVVDGTADGCRGVCNQYQVVDWQLIQDLFGEFEDSENS